DRNDRHRGDCRLTRLERLAVGNYDALEKPHRVAILHRRLKPPGLRRTDPPSCAVLGALALTPRRFNKPADIHHQLQPRDTAPRGPTAARAPGRVSRLRAMRRALSLSRGVARPEQVLSVWLAQGTDRSAERPDARRLRGLDRDALRRHAPGRSGANRRMSRAG